MEVGFFMIVNRNFARFLGFIFAMEFIVLVGFIIQHFIPDFTFSGNYIVRIAFLFITFIVGVVFFTWIAVDSNVSDETREDRGFFLIKGNIEYIKLAAIFIVFGVFLVFVISLILKIFSIY